MKCFWMVAVSTVALLAGCAGDTTEEDSEAGNDALSQSTVGAEAVAVEIHTIPMQDRSVKDKTTTIALPTRFKRIVSALKKRPANDPTPRCIPAYRNELRFLNAKGEETSKATLSCGGIGTLTVGNQDIKIKVNDTVDKMAAENLTVGDALWGITSVKITKPLGNHQKTIDDADDVQELVDAIKADQELIAPDPHAPVARCVPSYVVTFKRGNKDAAWTSFTCGNPPPSQISSSFSIPANGDAGGGAPPIGTGPIKLNPKPFVDAFATAN